MLYRGKSNQIKNLLKEFSEQGSWENLIVIDSPDKATLAESRNCLLLTDQVPSDKLVDLLFLKKVNHIIQFSNSDIKKNFENAANLISSNEKILTDPVGSILAGTPIRQIRIPIFQGVDKESVLNQVRSFVDVIPKANTVRDSSLIVVHELLINVMYDAPKYYQEIFKQVKLTQPPTNYTGEVIVAYDDKKILVGATDIFGSLDIEKLIHRLYETFQSPMVTVKQDPGSGAGLGCRMIFDLCTELYFSVDRGNQTFVGACLPIGMSYRKQQMTPKNVHIVDIK